MKCNDRYSWFAPTSRNHFQEHNKQMKAFRKSHPTVAMVNGPRYDQATLLERMEPMRISHIAGETGGARHYLNREDWSALVPLWKIARYKLLQN